MASLYVAIEAASTELACHAQRAYLERVRQAGRAQLGLELCFENNDEMKFAEAT